MFIKKVKINTNQKHSLYLVESYRDKEGKPKHRTIKNYGILEDLEKDNPNILEELREEAKHLTKDKKLDTTQTVDIDFDKLQTKSLINYGYIFLERLYKQIGISNFMKDYQINKKCQYDLDDTLKLLVFSRCLNPSSKKKTYENKGNYFFEFSDFKLEDIYKSLDYLADIKDELTYSIHQCISDHYGRDCTLVFYDVTNYYFESEEMTDLRQKGVSKENKKTGIVQMGLFIDRNGIPITYELFPGSTNDLSTMKPILEKIKNKYNLGKITIVADKGNNSGANLDYINEQGDKYIISQKIRLRGNKLADIVLDPEGYIENASGTFKYKTIKRVRDVKNKKGQVISSIDEHLLCFWSLKEERYQHAKRGILDEKIDKFMNDPSLLNASNSFGVKKYFKKTVYDKVTGEVVKAKNHYEFNEEKYQRDIALDGYYAIVTNDLELTPSEIIDKYRNLSVIEDSFRVTKTDLEGRPVYVWTDEHIKGHFLTCFIALTLYRLLQLETSNQYSVNQLKEALNSALVLEMGNGILHMNKVDPIIGELGRKYNQLFDKEFYKLEKFKRQLTTLLHS
ncbi:MAG: IS1634 family transposase [Candidatus Izemoplasmatales bacterium]|jgi:transposase|nr:IS1634 family transposase [Candidatus Izemoplasmatales bacterium]